jgi:hypothetical protein
MGETKKIHYLCPVDWRENRLTRARVTRSPNLEIAKKSIMRAGCNKGSHLYVCVLGMIHLRGTFVHLWFIHRRCLAIPKIRGRVNSYKSHASVCLWS